MKPRSVSTEFDTLNGKFNLFIFCIEMWYSSVLYCSERVRCADEFWVFIKFHNVTPEMKMKLNIVAYFN